MKVSKHAYIGIGVIAALGVAMPGFGASGNKYGDVTSQVSCKDSNGNTFGTVTLVGPLKLWPPNHKMVDEPVTAKATNSSDQVTLTLTPVVTDAAGGDGGTQHDPDFNATSSDGKTLVAGPSAGSATAALQLRAERSGKGDGRTYTINWDADFGGKKCSSGDSDKHPFLVQVPHDMRGGADWK